MKLSEETVAAMEETFEDVLKQCHDNASVQQIDRETLPEHLDNMRWAALDFACGMGGLNPDNFEAKAEDGIRALTEQLRALVALARGV